jgi:hypothetical protein
MGTVPVNDWLVQWGAFDQPVTKSVAAHHTYLIFITKIIGLILFRETIAVFSENHMEHTQKLGKMQSYLRLKQVVCIVTSGL